MSWLPPPKVDDTNAVSVRDPLEMHLATAGKHPAPTAAVYGTPSTGNVALDEITDALAVPGPASCIMALTASKPPRVRPHDGIRIAVSFFRTRHDGDTIRCHNDAILAGRASPVKWCSQPILRRRNTASPAASNAVHRRAIGCDPVTDSYRVAAASGAKQPAARFLTMTSQ